MDEKYIKLKNVFSNICNAFKKIKYIACFSEFPSDLEIAEVELDFIIYPSDKSAEFLKCLDLKKAASLKNSHEKYFYKKFEGEEYFTAYTDGLFYVAAFGAGNFELKRAGEFLCALNLCHSFSITGYAAGTDLMTGLLNHGYFQRALFENLSATIDDFKNARNRDWPVEYHACALNAGLLLFDIDNFKSFNDTFGHKLGDLVIIEVAAAARAAVKGHDGLIVARYGGEEFAVLLNGYSKELAVELGEKIRAAVENIDVAAIAANAGISLRVNRITISVGAAFYDLADGLDASFAGPDVAKSAAGLIKKADIALYGAKHLGKNRVVDYETVPSLCARVIDRRGDKIMVDVGYSHSINFYDRFEVFDGLYNGANEVISAKTSKKIGFYPKMSKGIISVSRAFDRFDATLMEKITLCDIVNENEPKIEPDDICLPVAAKEKFLCSGDIFLPAFLSGIRNYFDYRESGSDLHSACECFVMLNLNAHISELRYTKPEKISSFLRDAVSCVSLTQGLFSVNYLSADKIVFAYKKVPLSDAMASTKKAVDSIAAAYGLNPSARISGLDACLLSITGLPDAEIVRFLRVADFVNNYYKNSDRMECFDLQTYRKYGLFCFFCGMSAKALEVMRHCESIFGSGDFMLCQNIGGLALKLGHISEAEKYFKAAEALEPGGIVSKSNLALLYSLASDKEKAVKYYKQCIELAPDDPIFYNNLAFNLLKGGKELKLALKCAKKAVSLRKNNPAAVFLDTLAEVYCALTEYENAIETYKKIIRMQNLKTGIDIYLKLAYTYSKSNQRRLAKKILAALLSNERHNVYKSEIERYIAIIA